MNISMTRPVEHPNLLKSPKTASFSTRSALVIGSACFSESKCSTGLSHPCWLFYLNCSLEKTRGNPNRQEGSPFIKRDSKLQGQKYSGYKTMRGQNIWMTNLSLDDRGLTIDQNDVTATIIDLYSCDTCPGIEPAVIITLESQICT